MSEIFVQNAAILLDHGVIAETGIYNRENPGGELQISRLDRNTALYLGMCLTRELAEMYRDNFNHSGGMYTGSTSWNFPEVQELAKQNEEYSKTAPILGETRPANRNCAVKVIRDHRADRNLDLYVLRADIRNYFSDHPELEGGKFLQAGFIAVMDTVDLSDPSSWQ